MGLLFARYCSFIKHDFGIDVIYLLTTILSDMTQDIRLVFTLNLFRI